MSLACPWAGSRGVWAGLHSRGPCVALASRSSHHPQAFSDLCGCRGDGPRPPCPPSRSGAALGPTCLGFSPPSWLPGHPGEGGAPRKAFPDPTCRPWAVRSLVCHWPKPVSCLYLRWGQGRGGGALLRLTSLLTLGPRFSPSKHAPAALQTSTPFFRGGQTLPHHHRPAFFPPRSGSF